MSRRRPTNFVMMGTGKRASWDTIRAHVLRESPVCPCGAPSAEVDHVWPRYYGGDDQSHNLQALCVPCNRRKGNTIDVDAATEDHLGAGLRAVLDRGIAAADEIDRFLSPLVSRAMGWDEGDRSGAYEELRSARVAMEILAEAISCRRGQLTEYIAEYEERMDPVEMAMSVFFGGMGLDA